MFGQGCGLWRAGGQTGGQTDGRPKSRSAIVACKLYMSCANLGAINRIEENVIGKKMT